MCPVLFILSIAKKGEKLVLYLQKTGFMTHKGSFQLNCIKCKELLSFSFHDLEEQKIVSCPSCKKKYAFSDETLKRQLTTFAALCRQIQASEEILGSSGIGVTIGKEEVTIPFKLLLTRLKSTLDIELGKQKMQISFRIEPTALLKKDEK